MTKTDWESRVGMLLDPDRTPDFVYSYKPPDYKSGGQPRIDWFACDWTGRFWMIEVKSLPVGRQSINLLADITAGQRNGLEVVTETVGAVGMLAVGQESALHFLDWRDVKRWLLEHPGNNAIPLNLSFLTLTWTGPKHWPRNLLALLGE